MSNHLYRPAYATRLGNLTAKSVLVMLSDQANDEGMGWPSIASIVRGTEVCERVVRRMLEVFEGIGLVERKKTFVNDRFGARAVDAIYLNLSLLGTDLTEPFLVAYAGAQGKAVGSKKNGRKCLRDIPRSGGGDVSETLPAVSETVFDVSETIPPHPLFGRPVIDPVLDPPGAASTESAELPLDAAQQEHLDDLAAAGVETENWRLHYAEENRRKADTVAALAAEEVRLRAKYPTPEAGLAMLRRRCGFAWREGDKLGPVLRQVLDDQTELGKPFWRTLGQMEAAWELQRSQGLRLRARYGPMNFFGDGHWLNSDGWHWDTEVLKREGARVGS